ncbi:hypothetical protein SAMD00019534_058050 [Acytostelium subglobosum LB1]|uniref:hypothetical protein n=1 Tax=Acytostelium subglobosum LB1 TaxID=1410327 RepID=UPI000644ED5D|nr:hypothetical protein SAMD00019534_058050 [Acytostelium subglobosum LB1]GAM22630.1 hypothetical protein SAMD00019534_058050 [Acytostelium subglobosum LB1]|eukprot:XP_012754750.1 hypothetical protein SAMD00019534_058050 [Acytostelium subglobosum LB1]
MTYTPNSFVGILYGVSFLTGAWYGASRNRELKEKHRNLLIHDIKQTVKDTRAKAAEESFALGKASALPKSETLAAGFADEFDQLIADTVGDDLVRDLLA